MKAMAAEESKSSVNFVKAEEPIKDKQQNIENES